MGEALRRVQMLIEPGQHTMLARLAKREGLSVAEVTRQVITLGLEQLSQKDVLTARDRALQQADELAERIGARVGGSLSVDVVEDLRQLREKRDDQIAGSY
jgi:hypothetical protein